MDVKNECFSSGRPGGRLFYLLLTLFFTTPALTDQATHLRLIDPLDRPQDGYCIDIVGTPGYLRTDLPLFAHNCKPALTVDSAVVFEDGLIRFTTPDLCITVAGINSGALPGTAVVLHDCQQDSAFFQTATLQTFELHDNGSLELRNSGLCLVVGTRSATTYSAADQWRPLFVDDCQAAEPAYSRWRFSAPE